MELPCTYQMQHTGLWCSWCKSGRPCYAKGLGAWFLVSKAGCGCGGISPGSVAVARVVGEVSAHLQRVSFTCNMNSCLVRCYLASCKKGYRSWDPATWWHCSRDYAMQALPTRMLEYPAMTTISFWNGVILEALWYKATWCKVLSLKYWVTSSTQRFLDGPNTG